MTTSSSATSAIDICNRALVLIGALPITSFSDGTNEALVAVNLYEDTIQSSLVNTRWRFSTDQRQANRLTDAPTGRWTSAYAIPAESLMVNAVTVNDHPIHYAIYGNYIYNEADVNDAVIVDYTFRQTEANLPAYFVQALVYELAHHFALGVARDNGLSNTMFEKARYFMQKARTLDSQQQTTLKLNTSRFISQRRTTGFYSGNV